MSSYGQSYDQGRDNDYGRDDRNGYERPYDTNQNASTFEDESRLHSGTSFFNCYGN